MRKAVAPKQQHNTQTERNRFVNILTSDRQTDTVTDRQLDRKTERDRQIQIDADRQIDRQKARQTE